VIARDRAQQREPSVLFRVFPGSSEPGEPNDLEELEAMRIVLQAIKNKTTLSSTRCFVAFKHSNTESNKSKYKRTILGFSRECKVRVTRQCCF